MLINVDIMGSSIVQIRFPDEAACCRETLKTCGNQLIDDDDDDDDDDDVDE